MYPADWPRCPNCSEPALDGHITCGSAQCDEHGTRRRAAESYRQAVSETMIVPCITCHQPTSTADGPLCESCAVETHR